MVKKKKKERNLAEAFIVLFAASITQFNAIYLNTFHNEIIHFHHITTYTSVVQIHRNFCGVILLTVDSKLGLGGIGGAEVVGDDALVFALTGRFHMAQLQCGRVLRNLAPITRLCSEMGLVVNLCIVQHLVVLLPGEGHGRVTGAGCRAYKRHVGAFDG